jgi:hypothetical protein
VSTEPEEVPPPLVPNGKPEPTKVSDLVAVQNFLAGLIAQAETRIGARIDRYIEEHRKVHEEHEAWARPYTAFIDRERQKDEDWDARLRPMARVAKWAGRNWRTLAGILVAVLIALGVIRGGVHLGI